MTHIGIDIGYSSVKIAHGSGQRPELIRLPIGAAPVSKCGLAIDGSSAVGAAHLVTINGEPWVAGIEPGRLSDFVATMDEGYVTTDEYRALFYASLSAVGATKVKQIVTGLPVTHFTNAALKAGLEKMMLGRHYVRDDFVVEVENVMVVPQPAGAFGAHTLDGAYGRSSNPVEAGMSLLVVDPGHYSLDWVIFHDSFKLEHSGSTSNAGEVVVRRAAELLTQRFGVKVRPARLQDAVLKGAKPLQIGPHTVDFWPALQEVAGDIVKNNLKALQGSVRAVMDARGVDLVLVTGGGADLFKDALAGAFPEANVVTVRDSVTANARGFFVFATQQASRKRKAEAVA